jgi:hypothetical protein
MTSTAGADLRQGRAARTERERERGCAKWDRGVRAGAGDAQKGARARGRASWPGISAFVRECACAGPRRGMGKAELTGGPTAQREETGARGKRFSEMTRRAREAERERRVWARAIGADSTAPLGRGREGEGAG